MASLLLRKAFIQITFYALYNKLMYRYNRNNDGFSKIFNLARLFRFKFTKESEPNLSENAIVFRFRILRIFEDKTYICILYIKNVDSYKRSNLNILQYGMRRGDMLSATRTTILRYYDIIMYYYLHITCIASFWYVLIHVIHKCISYNKINIIYLWF